MPTMHIRLNEENKRFLEEIQKIMPFNPSLNKLANTTLQFGQDQMRTLARTSCNTRAEKVLGKKKG